MNQLSLNHAVATLKWELAGNAALQVQIEEVQKQREGLAAEVRKQRESLAVLRRKHADKI